MRIDPFSFCLGIRERKSKKGQRQNEQRRMIRNKEIPRRKTKRVHIRCFLSECINVQQKKISRSYCGETNKLNVSFKLSYLMYPPSRHEKIFDPSSNSKEIDYNNVVETFRINFFCLSFFLSFFLFVDLISDQMSYRFIQNSITPFLGLFRLENLD
jgi:hypothetical protein